MVSLILIAVAAILNGVMDVLANHFKESIFSRFRWYWWNPTMSWENKWRRGRKENGERFPGSSTVFVWLTDAWHLFKGLMLISVMAAIIFYKPVFGMYDFFLLFIVWGAFFEITLKICKT